MYSTYSCTSKRWTQATTPKQQQQQQQQNDKMAEKPNYASLFYFFIITVFLFVRFDSLYWYVLCCIVLCLHTMTRIKSEKVKVEKRGIITKITPNNFMHNTAEYVLYNYASLFIGWKKREKYTHSETELQSIHLFGIHNLSKYDVYKREIQREKKKNRVQQRMSLNLTCLLCSVSAKKKFCYFFFFGFLGSATSITTTAHRDVSRTYRKCKKKIKKIQSAATHQLSWGTQQLDVEKILPRKREQVVEWLAHPHFVLRNSNTDEFQVSKWRHMYWYMHANITVVRCTHWKPIDELLLYTCNKFYMLLTHFQLINK